MLANCRTGGIRGAFGRDGAVGGGHGDGSPADWPRGAGRGSDAQAHHAGHAQSGAGRIGLSGQEPGCRRKLDQRRRRPLLSGRRHRSGRHRAVGQRQHVDARPLRAAGRKDYRVPLELLNLVRLAHRAGPGQRPADARPRFRADVPGLRLWHGDQAGLARQNQAGDRQGRQAHGRRTESRWRLDVRPGHALRRRVGDRDAGAGAARRA